jgi:hypothetical protein
MATFASRITIAALIAGLVSAASTPAMAQWVSQPEVSSPFGNSVDFRPEWPDFTPLRAPGPNPPGAAELIEIPDSPHKNREPNVLILPRVIAPEHLPGRAA